ncbi:MAG: ABC transporter permease, partial [Bacteroidota bacterium]|nr:ABC transporter permease [Bacteroidota bacterium]
MRHIVKFFHGLGQYFLFLVKIISKPEKAKPYYNQIIREMQKIGLNSLSLVIIITLFMGAVITMQTAINFTN